MPNKIFSDVDQLWKVKTTLEDQTNETQLSLTSLSRRKNLKEHGFVIINSWEILLEENLPKFAGHKMRES